MNKRKICVITGSRAEYGLLYYLMQGVKTDPNLELQIIVTGMHLSPEFGLTYREILSDGFIINAKVEMLMSSDTPIGIGKSIGLGVIGFVDALSNLQPDILVLLGDRFEIFAAAQAALVLKIPVAHIGGGDTTIGAIDEAMRHSITKMSHLHFTTNKLAAKRITQLGENSEYIFNVGSPGIDQIRHLKLLTREELEDALNFKLENKNILITFHPVTLDITPPEEQFQELLVGIDNLLASGKLFDANSSTDIGIIFTRPNADTNGRIINTMIDSFVTNHSNAKAFVSLGQFLYLNTIAHVDVVVGNSSSGLYEAPSFKKPTVNIGNRQEGRILATSIINCKPNSDEIQKAILTAFAKDCSATINPYGDGDSSNKILQILKNIKNPQDLLIKRFFDLADGSEDIHIMENNDFDK